MMKATGYKLLVTVIFLLFTVCCSLSPAFASDSSGMENKINSLKNEIASRAAEIKGEVNKKVQNKVYAGMVSDISGNQITLNTKNGDRIVRVNEYTSYSSNVSQTLTSLSQISVNDFMVALGDVDDKNTLVAKKVLRDKPTLTTQNPPLFATIKSTTDSAITITTQDKKQLDLTISASILFKLTSKKALITDLLIGKAIIYITKGNDNTPQFIYLITQ
jgi:hypothetical protein